MDTSEVKANEDARVRVPTKAKAERAPRSDIYENADEFLLIVDVPGTAHEGLSINVEDGSLVLEARRTVDGNGVKGATEFREVDYKRVFRLSEAIDVDRVEAEFKDGTVRIRLPKAERLKPKRIAVSKN